MPSCAATLEYSMDGGPEVTRLMTITPGTTGEVVFSPDSGQEWTAGEMNANVALVDFDGKPFTQLCPEKLFVRTKRT